MGLGHLDNNNKRTVNSDSHPVHKCVRVL